MMTTNFNRQLSFIDKSAHFQLYNSSYSEYINKTKLMIAESRPELSTQQIALISPNEFIPTTTDNNASKPRGVLLIHGLLDTPYCMSSLFEHYQGKNNLVRSLLLPGHGTAPGDLLNVTVDDWLAATQYAIDSFKDEVTDLTFVGMSAGAALGIHMAQLGVKIDKLILFAPVLRLANPFARFAHLHQYAGAFWSRLHWWMINPENDFAKYTSIPFNAVAQVHQLSKRIEKTSNELITTIPKHYILSANDEVVCNASTINYYQEHRHPGCQLLLYTNKKQSFDNDASITQINSHDLANHILDYSHTCLTLSPEHPHYGAQGEYQDFLHYRQFFGKLHQKNRVKTIYQGAVSRENLRDYHLQRIRYNPKFHEMMDYLTK